MISIHIQSQALTALAQKADAIDKSEELLLAGGRAARNLAQSHLSDLAGSRHRAASPQNFYEDAAKSLTDVVAGNGSASFQINKLGMAQRLLGGDIRAGKGISSFSGKPTRFLAIPARDEAVGRTPGQFPNLEFIPRGPGRGMLVEKFLTPLTGASGQRLKNPARGAENRTIGGLVMFWLVDHVHQDPDPTVLPTTDEFQTAAATEMQSYLSELLKTN